ncbi:mannose-1-phosphate guanylyltransferase/mannose-6-phosphate isomerase [Pararhizobium haloflavum]|uniref:mannose-1-phosphate guanylyltransferase/mannose-6-phosphate isomerase n=1 Tax=Pararhizobium haloflavum TaxID=2037914 RepID=UPI000C19DD43|nr:mannose-1-phosphate guanylyltransferase/mannose-6-phosphate isomerase [Pararhizobium haloflavum]
MLLPVILAGGSGTRLWPLSRQLNPKQFLALTSEHTMLQETVRRLDGFEIGAPIVICNEEHRFLAAEQMHGLGFSDATIMLEPVGRNTAPAITLAALKAMGDGKDPLLLVLAADHLIRDRGAFQAAVSAAEPLAEAGRLVTFGIVPDRPETGYGYIQRGAADGPTGYKVERFVEKPDLETAQGYVDGGRHFWNSGMFLFRASRYLGELERHRPEMIAACRKALDHAARDLDFVRIDRPAFEACPSDSIDYAVMEKTDDAAMVPLDAGWSDIGSWSALWDVSEKDASGNAFAGDVLSSGASNTLVRADQRLVAVVGTHDLVVIETKDALLVAHKDRVQDVKNIVSQIKDQGRQEHFNHREIYRPWGHYDTVDGGSRDAVRRITVKPGARLATQMHNHRAEHWIVVSGTAAVTKGDQVITLRENESTYIAAGEIHGLENRGSVPLEIIEVQTGSYLGEDDVTRFEGTHYD